MSDKPSKWFDPEAIEEKEHEALPLKAIHKKIAKKHDNIAKGLREYKESMINNKDTFLKWAKPKNIEKNPKTAQLLASASNFNIAKAELKIKKIFKTDQRDSIGSVVQALDYCPETQTFAFAGLDKVLKLLKPNHDTAKGYDIASSIFFEGLPIQNAVFANKNSLILSYFNKKFVSLFDLPTQKPVHYYKLFTTDFIPHKAIVNKNGLSVISNTKELCIFDTAKKISVSKALQPDTVKDICEIQDNEIAVAYETDSIKIFDIRVSLSRPKHVIKKSVDVIASNGRYLCSGNRNGIVQLFDATDNYNLVKTYDHITTEITSIDINSNYMAFSSKWKNNSIRLVDLRNLSVYPTWPNIKTKLDVINRVIVNSNDQLVCGTDKGSLDAYQLSLI